jgi:hypothetical protein
MPMPLFMLALSLLSRSASAAPPALPLHESHRTLERTISYPEMEAFLRSVDGKGGLRVSVEGTSAKGRSIFLVHAGRGNPGAWKILLYAQQHGDEVSGKDALLFLLRDLARKPDVLPKDVDLWVLPMMNPDGAEAGMRWNGAGADLNRDHLALEQPETQALHRVARRIRPDVAIDCHEFARDSSDWRERGWTKWPDITLDGLNNPLFDASVIAASRRFVDAAAEAETKAGHPFLRYWVGGLPPWEEQRHSAPDVDSGLNAIGMYGGLSFIAEAAAPKSVAAPPGDLGNRIDAYLVLFRRLIEGDGHRAADREAIAKARRRPLPAFLPTNYLWANPTAMVTAFPVVETATGRVVKVSTPNLMTDLVVKRSVPTPLGYAVEARAAGEFRSLLDRHGIPFETLSVPKTVTMESCTLLRVEEKFDEVHSRYEGRQVVRCSRAVRAELPPGSLSIPLEGEAAVRAALVLEPSMLYGLYQVPAFRALAAPDGTLPVRRIVTDPADFVAFVPRAPRASLPEPAESALAALSVSSLRAHIEFLSAPAREGRGLGTAGLKAAEDYAISRFSSSGVSQLPGPGEGKVKGVASWFQQVPLREVSGPGGSLTIERRQGNETVTRTFASGVDCQIPPVPARTVTVRAIDGGWGIREIAPARDDFAGIDVRGSAVLVRDGLPTGPEWQTPALKERYAPAKASERWDTKLETASRLGAAAVLAVDAGLGRAAGKDARAERSFWRAADPGTDSGEALLVRISPAVAELLRAETEGGPVSVTIRAEGRERLLSHRNVVGFLEGSDPELRRDAIVVGAHLDHLGTVDGKVCPGADDNASGASALLEIASVLARLPASGRSKRSLVFVLWTGEEEGKLGSGHWVRNPLWPLDRTAAYVNLDMIGHPWSMDEIRDLVQGARLPDSGAFLGTVTPALFVEPGLDARSPALGDALVRAARGTGMALHLDRTDGRWGGSDYRDFARRGIPWIRFFGSFFPGYHGPGDTADRLDIRQVHRVARLALATVWLLADR